MLQVGKKYRVASPEASIHLGFAGIVKITKKENGMFQGDNNDWYYEDGRHVIVYPLISPNKLDLVSEVDA